MDELKILNSNFEAKDNSFLYYLHEESYFHETALAELYGCISSLCYTHPHDKLVSAQICFVYGQVLRHIIYHFDSGDLCRISNLPCCYNKKFEMLEQIVAKYFLG